MTGPCLCGDPYCPSCGDPGLAEKEAAHEAFAERLWNTDLAAGELDLLFEAGMAAVKAHRAVFAEMRRNDEMAKHMEEAAKAAAEYYGEIAKREGMGGSDE